MADTLGNVQIPALNNDSPLGDPLLSILLQFWKQCLVNGLTNVWTVACPNIPVVKTMDERDPTINTLTTTELPALFIQRVDYGELEWRAIDYPRIPSKIRLWWVLPRLELKWRRQRATIMQAALAALLFQTEMTARAPGLIFPGDPDPVAQTKGSLIWKYAKIWSIDWKKASPQKLVIDLEKEGKLNFDAVVWELQLYEKLTLDTAQHSSPNDGLDDSVADDGLPLITVQAKIRLSSSTPRSGSHLGGTAFTLIGTQLEDLSTITIGGAACTEFVWLDATRVSAVSPAGTTGAADIVLTNPEGDVVTLPGGWTYT